MTTEISVPVLSLWATLVEERTGILFRPDDPFLGSKLAVRAAEAGFDSPLDYYYFVRHASGAATEFDALIDALVVNETYFFRESEQLRVLCESVLRPMVLRGERPRVWSAGCSTGEEPLTLAMLLDEIGLLSSVDIVASDIGQRALARAREGEYSERSLRSLPGGVMGRWIESIDGRARASSRLRDAIDWRRVNLIDPVAVQALGTFDAILCRNVFIYFSDDTVQRVLGTMVGALHEGAPLLVGTAESLLRFGTQLKWEERSGAFFHVRP